MTLQEETVSLTSPSVETGWVKACRPDGKKLFKPSQHASGKRGWHWSILTSAHLFGLFQPSIFINKGRCKKGCLCFLTFPSYWCFDQPSLRGGEFPLTGSVGPVGWNRQYRTGNNFFFFCCTEGYYRNGLFHSEAFAQ